MQPKQQQQQQQQPQTQQQPLVLQPQQQHQANNSSNTIALPKASHANTSEELAGGVQDTIYLCNFRVSVDGEWLCLKELQDIDVAGGTGSQAVQTSEKQGGGQSHSGFGSNYNGADVVVVRGQLGLFRILDESTHFAGASQLQCVCTWASIKIQMYIQIYRY